MKTKTPFEEAGFKATDTFKLKEGELHHELSPGDTLSLKRDDGTTSPFFWNSNRTDYHAVKLESIEIVDMNHKARPLLDILIEELPKIGGWPKGAGFIASDSDGEIYSYTDLPVPDRSGCNYIDGVDEGYHSMLFPPSMFDVADWDCSVISREQYEAALAAKADDWIEWTGGECPVADGTLVDVKLRDGSVTRSREGQSLIWKHYISDGIGNIIAYRLHQPQEIDTKASSDCQDESEAIIYDLIGEVRTTGVDISLSDAFSIAERLVKSGYRKQH